MTPARDAVALAEKILALLSEGSFSATYKYALFIALLDLCLEQTTRHGTPPHVLTTRQLAEKTVELYWPHALPYDGRKVLRQSGGVRSGGQAAILRAITDFRAEHDGSSSEMLFRSRARHATDFEVLIRSVEWKLIEMPIPRLQVLGREEERFLYEYGWNQDVRRANVTAYQRGTSSAFDNRILLREGVAAQLVQLNGVLRPLIQREWARMVAAMNDLPETRLEEFLFGSSRIPLDTVRAPLREIQEDRCFYCDKRLNERSDVDHFIPWARHPDNGLDNLVVAHAPCNNAKRDFLAAAEHVERWAERTRASEHALDTLAKRYEWTRDTQRTFGVARAMYLRLSESTRLWRLEKDFVTVQKERIALALAA